MKKALGPEHTSTLATVNNTDRLCESCRGLGLETKGVNWILSKEQADYLGATFYDAGDKDDRRLITYGVIHDVLQTMNDCPLCLLIFVAIQEQYKAKDKKMWTRDPN